jgi:hypothetical protein
VSRSDDAAHSTQRYRERLGPPWWLWLAAFIAAASLFIAYAAATTAAIGAVVGIVAFIVQAALLQASATTISIEDGQLTAGSASIPVEWLAAPTALTRDEAAALRGRDADPRAWMVLRGWIPEAVRVDVTDPDDDTPYWYLSSRHAVELSSAIATAQRAAG